MSGEDRKPEKMQKEVSDEESLDYFLLAGARKYSFYTSTSNETGRNKVGM